MSANPLKPFTEKSHTISFFTEVPQEKIIIRNQLQSDRVGLNNQVAVFEKQKKVHQSSNNTDCICLKSSQEFILISETALLTALFKISKSLIEF